MQRLTRRFNKPIITSYILLIEAQTELETGVAMVALCTNFILTNTCLAERLIRTYRSHKENVPDYRFSQAMAEGPLSPLRQSLFKYALLCLCQLHASSCSTDHVLIWLWHTYHTCHQQRCCCCCWCVAAGMLLRHVIVCHSQMSWHHCIYTPAVAGVSLLVCCCVMSSHDLL